MIVEFERPRLAGYDKFWRALTGCHVGQGSVSRSNNQRAVYMED